MPTWHLIGYEEWVDGHGPPYMAQAFYAYPNPSASPMGKDLTPEGHWHYTYAADGTQTSSTFYADVLTWIVEEQFLKGSHGIPMVWKGAPKGGKGNPKGGKGKGPPTGKGQGTSIGKGKGKGKPKGKGKGEGKEQDI